LEKEEQLVRDDEAAPRIGVTGMGAGQVVQLKPTMRRGQTKKSSDVMPQPRHGSMQGKESGAVAASINRAIEMELS
jgi:hypothetical protein